METLYVQSPPPDSFQPNLPHTQKLHCRETSTPPPLWLQQHAQDFLEDSALIRPVQTSSGEQIVLSRVNARNDVLSCGCVGLCLLGCWEDLGQQTVSPRPTAGLQRSFSFSSGRRLFLSPDLSAGQSDRQIRTSGDLMPSPFSSPLTSPSSRTRDRSLSVSEPRVIDLGKSDASHSTAPTRSERPDSGLGSRTPSGENDSSAPDLIVSLPLTRNSDKENNQQLWKQVMALLVERAREGTDSRYTPVQRDLKVRRFKEKKRRSALRPKGKKVLYECRRRFAIVRPRVGGRFVKKKAICSKQIHKPVRSNCKKRKKRT